MLLWTKMSWKPMSNLPIPKMSDSGLFASNDMPSSSSHSDQLNDVSFIKK